MFVKHIAIYLLLALFTSTASFTSRNPCDEPDIADHCIQLKVNDAEDAIPLWIDVALATSKTLRDLIADLGNKTILPSTIEVSINNVDHYTLSALVNGLNAAYLTKPTGSYLVSDSSFKDICFANLSSPTDDQLIKFFLAADYFASEEVFKLAKYLIASEVIKVWPSSQAQIELVKETFGARIAKRHFAWLLKPLVRLQKIMANVPQSMLSVVGDTIYAVDKSPGAIDLNSLNIIDTKTETLKSTNLLFNGLPHDVLSFDGKVFVSSSYPMRGNEFHSGSLVVIDPTSKADDIFITRLDSDYFNHRRLSVSSLFEFNHKLFNAPNGDIANAINAEKHNGGPLPQIYYDDFRIAVSKKDLTTNIAKMQWHNVTAISSSTKEEVFILENNHAYTNSHVMVGNILYINTSHGMNIYEINPWIFSSSDMVRSDLHFPTSVDTQCPAMFTENEIQNIASELFDFQLGIFRFKMHKRSYTNAISKTLDHRPDGYVLVSTKLAEHNVDDRKHCDYESAWMPVQDFIRNELFKHGKLSQQPPINYLSDQEPLRFTIVSLH